MTEIGTVAVGGYELRVGDVAGTEIREGSVAKTDGDEALIRAFAEPEPERPTPGEAFATEVAEAGEVTAKVEQTAALCKGIAAGEALSPDQLAIEIGTILDLCERLDRKKKYKEELRLARGVANLLMLLKRWAQLLQMLRTVLRLGQELNDLEAVAWAKHELGTLRLAAGQAKEAERELGEALEIRERIGDRRGAALTNRNLQVLCKRLRRMLRDDEFDRSAPRRRPMRLLPIAALLAFFLAGGVVGAVIGDGREAANHTEAGDGTTTTGTDTGPVEEEFRLRVVFTGDGTGRVRGEGNGCTRTCEGEVEAGEEVVLRAEADEGSEFAGFSGPCQGATCTFRMNGDATVTATFLAASNPSGDLEEEERTAEEADEKEHTAQEAKELAEQSQTAEEEASAGPG